MAGDSFKKHWLFVAAASAAFVGVNGGVAFAQEGASTSDEIVVTATRREARLQDVPVAVTPVTAELIQNAGIRDVSDLAAVAPALQFNVSENETSATARLRGVGTQGSNPGLESAVGIFVDGVYRARNGVALGDLGEVSQIEVLRGPQGTLFGRNTSAGLISITTAGPDLDEFGANAEATVGSYGEQRLSGSVSVPIVQDVIAGKVFAAYGKRDGLIDVIAPNGSVSDSNNRDFWTVRGQLQWELFENTSLRIIGDYTERDELCCAAKLYNATNYNGATNVFNGATGTTTPYVFPNGQQTILAGLGGFGPGGLGALTRANGSIEERFAFANRTYDQQIEDQGVSAELNVELGDVTFTSVSAYRDWNYAQGQDTDFTGADIWFRDVNSGNGFGFEIFTQEFRLAGQAGPVDWLFGYFYADETLRRKDNLTIGTQYADFWAPQLLPGITAAFTPTLGATGAAAFANAMVGNPSTGPLSALQRLEGGGLRDSYKQSGESSAFFTHNIIALDDKTDLTLGLRYTVDRKTLRAGFSTLNSAVDAVGQTDLSFLSTALQPTLRAAALGAVPVFNFPWHRTQLNAVGYNQGATEREWSGVVSARRELTDTTSAYISFSRGYKAGGFNLDRDFGFVTTGRPPSSRFEPEFVEASELGFKNAFAGGDLLLNVALYYNEYENFQLNRFDGTQFVVTSVPEVTAQGVEVDAIWDLPIEGLSYQGGVSYNEAEYGDNTGWARGDLAILPGRRLTNAPLWTTSHALTYERPLTEMLTGTAFVDFRYESDQNTGSGLQDVWVRPSNFIVNGRLAIGTADDRYTLEVWGKNLTDETTGQIMFGQPLAGNAYGAFLNEPRTYGVTLRASY